MRCTGATPKFLECYLAPIGNADSIDDEEVLSRGRHCAQVVESRTRTPNTPFRAAGRKVAKTSLRLA